MFNRFIERPVLSTVISILIVILGVLGLTSLPVARYPEIASKPFLPRQPRRSVLTTHTLSDRS